MEFRTAPGSRGLAWFQGGVRVLDRNPRGLLAVSLGLVLVHQVPSLLGAVPALWAAVSIVLLLLVPALQAGLFFAIDEACEGRPVAPMHLFEGLRRPGARAQLIVLGMAVLVASVLVALAARNILGDDGVRIFAQIMDQAIKPDSKAAQSIALPLLKAMASAMAILFVLMSGLFFAVPRVMFDGRKALPALGESILACAANVLPLTLYGLVLGAVGFVAFLGLGIVAAMLGLLGQVGALLFYGVFLAVIVVCLLVSTSGNYLAWREVFGHAGRDRAVPPQAGIIV
ncbi:MAG TPA: BPSS1780 family membrane protein [Xanthomonadaceae bacterium]|jgi:hypothetical protein